MASPFVRMVTAIIWVCLAAYLIQPISGRGYEDLKGAHIKVSAFQVGGYLSIQKAPDGNYTFSGLLRELYDWMFDDPRAGISYEWVLVNITKVIARGFVQANIDQLLNGEVDVSSMGFIPTAERLQFMEFSVSTAVEQYRFIVPYPSEESRLWAPIRPFQPSVWALFFGATVAFILTLSLIVYRSDDFPTTKTFVTLISDNTVFTITLLISNAEYYQKRTLIFRVFLGIFCLMCIIIVNSYTGNLTSSLAIPSLKPIPNSFEELAKSDELSVIVEDKGVLAEQMLKATSGPFKALGDSLRKNPKNLFKTIQESDVLLASHATVYPGIGYLVHFPVAKALQSTRKCEFTLSKPLDYYQTFCAGLPKNGRYNGAINYKMQYIWEMGLMKLWQRKFTPLIGKCLVGNKEKPKEVRVNLVALSSAFLLLGCGTGLSLIVFMMENLLARKKSNP